MQIFIPTCGRAERQPTYHALQKADMHPVLVVQEREWAEYANYPNKIALPPEIQRIAGTRQYILDQCVVDTAFCMVDDDLVFFKRRDDDPTKLRDITDAELFEAFQKMENWLLTGGAAHVGFAPREGANRNTAETIDNTRIMRVLGYSADVLRSHSIRFDTMEVMEDFHVALQLLELGFENLILNNYAHNQASSNAAGGCSTWRTPALHARNAELLASLHPKFVKVVEKTTKTAWGGGTRKDVNIQWKKAYASSQH